MLKYTKNDDLIESNSKDGKIDLSPFIGSWTNTKEGSGQLPIVQLRIENDTLLLNAFGADKDGLMAWGESPCEVYATSTHDGTAIAFLTSFSLDEIDVKISANVKLGVLVIQTYTIFKDGSGRLNYYTREFYGPTQND